jgi:hypothetical protein
MKNRSFDTCIPLFSFMDETKVFQIIFCPQYIGVNCMFDVNVGNKR